MQKVTFSDFLYSGTNFSGKFIVEDLIPLSRVSASNNVVHCVVSREKLKDEMMKRSRNFKSSDFEHFVDFVFEEPIVVQNTYFSIDTNSFEEQQVIFTLEDE